jgi:endonuclease-3
MAMTDNLPDDPTQRFLVLFHRAKHTYEDTARRLAAEGWDEPWQVLISTIMSAQNRDQNTIRTAEALFDAYPAVNDLAEADYDDVLDVFSSINYNKSKTDYVITTANTLIDEYNGDVPSNRDDLLSLKGVGRKTANLVLSTVFDAPAICVDTHVHRISNVFNLVNTDSADGTEDTLQDVAPKQYWKHINRYFVLWGQDQAGHDPDDLLSVLDDLPTKPGGIPPDQPVDDVHTALSAERVTKRTR